MSRSRSLREWRPSTTVQPITQTSWRSPRGRSSWWRGRRTASGGWVTQFLFCFWQIWVCVWSWAKKHLDFAVSDRSRRGRADQTRSVSRHFCSLHHRVTSDKRLRCCSTTLLGSDLWCLSWILQDPFCCSVLTNSLFLSVLCWNSQNFILISRRSLTCQTEFWGTCCYHQQDWEHLSTQTVPCCSTELSDTTGAVLQQWNPPICVFCSYR